MGYYSPWYRSVWKKRRNNGTISVITTTVITTTVITTTVITTTEITKKQQQTTATDCSLAYYLGVYYK